jgi:hypothetical protein
MSLTVDPIRKFEQRGEACKLTGVYLQTTVANNILVVTGVTGKIIRIMGIHCGFYRRDYLRPDFQISFRGHKHFACGGPG